MILHFDLLRVVGAIHAANLSRHPDAATGSLVRRSVREATYLLREVEKRASLTGPAADYYDGIVRGEEVDEEGRPFDDDFIPPPVKLKTCRNCYLECLECKCGGAPLSAEQRAELHRRHNLLAHPVGTKKGMGK